MWYEGLLLKLKQNLPYHVSQIMKSYLTNRLNDATCEKGPFSNKVWCTSREFCIYFLQQISLPIKITNKTCITKVIHADSRGLNSRSLALNFNSLLIIHRYRSLICDSIKIILKGISQRA